MTNHVRIGIHAITNGTYGELIERARAAWRLFCATARCRLLFHDHCGGRFVSVSTWQTREQARRPPPRAPNG